MKIQHISHSSEMMQERPEPVWLLAGRLRNTWQKRSWCVLRLSSSAPKFSNYNLIRQHNDHHKEFKSVLSIILHLQITEDSSQASFNRKVRCRLTEASHRLRPRPRLSPCLFSIHEHKKAAHFSKGWKLPCSYVLRVE